MAVPSGEASCVKWVLASSSVGRDVSGAVRRGSRSGFRCLRKFSRNGVLHLLQTVNYAKSAFASFGRIRMEMFHEVP
jgi:hypothetical protein